MQFGRLVAAGVLGVAGAESRGRLVSTVSPTTRVVELLESLAKKAEAETEAEEKLYEKFVCWAKTIVSDKTAANAAAESRSEELRTYIDDLQNGRIELTSERADLTKQLEELNAAIEAATQLRANENKDYLVAKDEMQKALDALSKATKVLGAATGGNKDGVLLATKVQLGSSAEARAKEADSLLLAVDLGSRVLDQADSSFLRRVLTGEVPKPDWKKLNRKATFKMTYKARSFKIQDVLAKLLSGFQRDLREADSKEQAALELYNKLMESKEAEKEATEVGLQKMEKENGAAGMGKEESLEEMKSLTTQIANDKKYIEQVQQALDEKKVEWKDRQELRAGEQEAISQAISILRSDDARDLMKRSLASQGFLFLQEASATRAASAASVLRLAAQEAGGARLAALALRLGRSGRSHLAEVITAIDGMLQALQAEEDEDLVKKNQCEADRATDTREAIKVSRAMDELTDEVLAGKSKIEQLTQQIQAKTEQVAAAKEELVQATEMRKKENAEWQTTDKDDKDAKAVVLNAKKVLEKFYKESGLALAQTPSRAWIQQPESQAGKAPPPPPSTWDAPYSGAQDESTGIVSMLDMIAQDIEQDITKAAEEEAKSQTLYEKGKAAMEAEVKQLGVAISDLDGQSGDHAEEVTDNVGERSTKRGELEVVLKTIHDAAPGCDFFAVNYPTRVLNRHTEVDGLNKAKTILSGGKSLLQDEKHAESGDSFLQARTRKFLGRKTAL